MKKMSFLAVLVAALTIGNVQAQTLRSGGCSDLYGAGPSSQASDEVAVKSSRTRLISTGANDDSSNRYVGLFHRGGCSGGSCLAPLHAGAHNYYQAPAVNYYAAPTYAAPTYSAPVYAAPNVAYQTPMVAAASAGCGSCGNAVVAYGNTIHSQASCAGAVMLPTEQRNLIDVGPINSYKVVLEPKYFTETRGVATTEYKNETRYRTRIVARTVPVESQDYKTITVMVPRSETKTIEYSVLVPQTSEKTVEVVETVPVWTDVAEQYTVKVPTVVDVPEEYKVRVPQLVDQDFTYTVQVPQSLTETRLQAVTNAIPVTKTRTVETYQPVTRTQTVTKDYGHWEVRVEEVAVAAPAVSYAAPACATAPAYSTGYAAPAQVGGCGQSGCGQASCGNAGCGSRHRGCGLFRRGGCGASAASCGSGCSSGCASGGCGTAVNSGIVYSAPTPVYSEPTYAAPAACATTTTQTVTRRVWVPNVVTEEVSVVENVPQSQEVAYTVYEQRTEQVPYECTYLVYRPESRTGTRKVVNYVEESRTRNRKVVQYNDEVRTRTRKQLSYKQETRTETIPVVSYTTEKRTKEVSYTFNVPETKVEPFTSTRFETVNEEVSEEYTVSVPVSTVKEVQVQVCRMVPKLVPVTIYPCAGGSDTAAACAGGCAGTPSPAPALNGGCSGCASGCSDCK